jgi:hypothetical protein
MRVHQDIKIRFANAHEDKIHHIGLNIYTGARWFCYWPEFDCIFASSYITTGARR